LTWERRFSEDLKQRCNKSVPFFCSSTRTLDFPHFLETNLDSSNTMAKRYTGSVTCTYIHALLSRHIQHTKVLEWDEFFFNLNPSIRNLPAMALNYIIAARMETRCTSAGCGNSLQSTGKDFKRCSSCNVAPYCGCECQTRAWKHGNFPHKSVCPRLNNLLTLGGGWEAFPGHPEYSSSASTGPIASWRAARVDDTELQYVADSSRVLEFTFLTEMSRHLGLTIMTPSSCALGLVEVAQNVSPTFFVFVARADILECDH
jgi:hypothetical protein